MINTAKLQFKSGQADFHSMNSRKPHQTVNKAYRKLKIQQNDLDKFRKNLRTMLDQMNPGESEEYHKNLIQAFLKDTFYGSRYAINTSGATDLVVHTGKSTRTPVGVMIETKKPGNASEMVREGYYNTKALQELLLYYYRQRIDEKNQEIKYLIATDLYQWFIFDATRFEKLFVSNKKWRNLYEKFKSNQLAGNTTDWFYTNIASPAIIEADHQLQPTIFDLNDYTSMVRPGYSGSFSKLITLYKLLSPETLLKLPFANDSNTLNKPFYDELLHIIGLTEVKAKQKKLIQRKPEKSRDPASLIENTINQIKFNDKLIDLKNPQRYGDSDEERIYTVALELVLTWINRILFLKLLEGQLLTWHAGDDAFRFLTTRRIPDFDELSVLFFRVLAVDRAKRSPEVEQAFPNIPYLNSSLFEMTPLEHQIFTISNLRDNQHLPLHPHSILKQSAQFRKQTELNALEYLFQFLNAYDFSSDAGADEVQAENTSIINASVLGLIFEKINGYKDGSFFTPGFITMYMAREALRRAVVDKFNQVNGWTCQTLTDVYNRIEDKSAANAVVNSLRICDPAVGSGHFLVSALNELIAIKWELGILMDDHGKMLRDYDIGVENDELVITDDQGDFFQYRPGNQESLRVQRTLFQEKQTIIESCLFGVDINPNATNICRLRLWIELLKNAYYKDAELRDLETLPNIDINIKTGNSLISRFALDEDLKQALKKSNHTIDAYKLAVQTYHETTDRAARKQLLELIKSIKKDFRSEIKANDPLVKRKLKLETEFAQKYGPQQLFNQNLTAAQKKDMEKLAGEIEKLRTEIKTIESNKIYQNAFEWRFEFPEVLDHDGNFVGFDVVMGNPPYIRQEQFTDLKPYLLNHFETYAGTADLYVYFVEQGLRLLRSQGQFCFILPNKWMRAGYGKRFREYLKKYQVNSIVDFGDLPVFEEATTYPCILAIAPKRTAGTFKAVNVESLNFPDSLADYVQINHLTVDSEKLSPSGWVLADAREQALLEKIRQQGTPLGEYVEGKIYRGVLTGLNEAFVIGAATREKLIGGDPRSAEIIKPFLAGRDIKRYQQPVSDKYLIFTRRGIDIEKYPAIYEYLEQYRERLEPKPKNFTGKGWPGRKPGSYKWYEIQDAVDYYGEFEKPKIVIPAIVKSANYAFDRNGNYSNDKTTIIPTDELILLGILNSRIVDYYLMHIASTKQNGYYEYKPVYISQLPIIFMDKGTCSTMESEVQKILTAKRADPAADTTALEAEIDKMVYDLYGLTAEEVKVVEGEEE